MGKTKHNTQNKVFKVSEIGNMERSKTDIKNGKCGRGMEHKGSSSCNGFTPFSNQRYAATPLQFILTKDVSVAFLPIISKIYNRLTKMNR